MNQGKLGGRLTESAVRDIRERLKRGETYHKIANAHGVSIGTVYNIAKNRTWKGLV